MSNSIPRKSYVVFNGRKPGVYTTFIDCYAQANGFKESIIRLYDNNHEGQHAWGQFCPSKKTSLLKRDQIEKSVNDSYGMSCVLLNGISVPTGIDDCVEHDGSRDILIGHSMEKWLIQACHYMRIEQPLFILHDFKDINGKRHYRFRASLVHKSIGKPPISLGRYARTIYQAREDAAVLMLRRLLSCNEKAIVDYNQHNVDILECQLQKSLDENFELRMENAALSEELRILGNISDRPTDA